MQEQMRWLGIMVVVSLMTAACLWFPGRGERRCVNSLAVFDHHINCSGHVALGQSDGTVSNGVWDRKYILDLTPPTYLRCPLTGTNYMLSFKVGEHPYCPIHGHLIEKYGVRPHQTWLRAPAARAIGGPVFLLLALVGGATLLAVAVAKRRAVR
jgi:hypothetical protein